MQARTEPALAMDTRHPPPSPRPRGTTTKRQNQKGGHRSVTRITAMHVVLVAVRITAMHIMCLLLVAVAVAVLELGSVSLLEP